MCDQTHNLICEAKASLLSRKIELSSYRDLQKDQPFPYQADMLKEIDITNKILGRISCSYTSVLTINSSDDSLLITKLCRNPNATEHYTYPISHVTTFAEIAKDRAT